MIEWPRTDAFAVKSLLERFAICGLTEQEMASSVVDDPLLLSIVEDALTEDGLALLRELAAGDPS